MFTDEEADYRVHIFRMNMIAIEANGMNKGNVDGFIEISTKKKLKKLLLDKYVEHLIQRILHSKFLVIWNHATLFQQLICTCR